MRQMFHVSTPPTPRDHGSYRPALGGKDCDELTASLRPHGRAAPPGAGAASPHTGPTTGSSPHRPPRTLRPPAPSRPSSATRSSTTPSTWPSCSSPWRTPGNRCAHGSRAATGLYMLVYTFHMPAFIIISGYFSRSFDMRPDRLRRLVTGSSSPMWSSRPCTRCSSDGPIMIPRQRSACWTPGSCPWFLVALFIWRLTTPLWKSSALAAAVALAIACLASVSPDIGDDLDLQRVLQFLPFFVLGLCMKPEHFRMVRAPLRSGSPPCRSSLAAVVFAYWAAHRMAQDWLFHRDAAQELGAPWWAGDRDDPGASSAARWCSPPASSPGCRGGGCGSPPGCRHPVRLSAARFRREGRELLRLVRRLPDPAQADRRDRW